MSAATASTKLRRSENKEAKGLAVSIAILEIIESEGLLGVTHSKVARKSKVSRAWIYEYVGKEKVALIEFGADFFAGHFARTNLTALPQSKDELEMRLHEGMQYLFDSVESNPVIIKLFFRFRGSANVVGKIIQKHEKQWMKAATETIQKVVGLPDVEASLLAELVLTLRLGFAHRVASTTNSHQARVSAENIFAMIHGLLAETTGTISN